MARHVKKVSRSLLPKRRRKNRIAFQGSFGQQAASCIGVSDLVVEGSPEVRFIGIHSREPKSSIPQQADHSAKTILRPDDSRDGLASLICMRYGKER